jgi:hypothetical protein
LRRNGRHHPVKLLKALGIPRRHVRADGHPVQANKRENPVIVGIDKVGRIDPLLLGRQVLERINGWVMDGQYVDPVLVHNGQTDRKNKGWEEEEEKEHFVSEILFLF